MTEPRTPVPGRGLSYAELLSASASPDIREAWSALAVIADVLGIPDSKRSIAHVRVKTIDELLDDLAEALPEGATPEDALAATQHLLAERPAATVYEVRWLRQCETGWEWALFAAVPDRDLAQSLRERQAETTGHLYTVVKIVTSTESCVL